MFENKTRPAVATHCRLHDRDGYVLSIDIDVDVSIVANHILELRARNTPTEKVIGRLDPNTFELISETDE